MVIPLLTKGNALRAIVSFAWVLVTMRRWNKSSRSITVSKDLAPPWIRIRRRIWSSDSRSRRMVISETEAKVSFNSWKETFPFRFTKSTIAF